MISFFFIRRPIFATVVSIIIVLAGIMAIFALPIEQYPDLAPPTINVSAVYPGADAQTVQETVASVLETKINGVEDMIYMSSTSSSNGQVSISVYFNVGTDPDQATINVNNRVQLATSQLPEEVRRQGVSVTKRSTSMVMLVAVTGDERYTDLYVSNYANLNIADELKRVSGVGDVSIFGEMPYSIRIWLNTDKLAQLGLTASDVNQAIQEQNIQLSLGYVGQEPTNVKPQLTYSVTGHGRLAEPREFENILIRVNPDGSSLRVKDVARVELGSDTYSSIGWLNGKPATLLAIFTQPGANMLDVANRVEAELEKISQRFPDGISYKVAVDMTRFVRVSIREVIQTLFEAFALVFIVVFVFLHNWRATVIPLLAVPVSLIGTFAGLYIFGFSINTLTLFAMVLAIGIVVDDAIIVLENVERILAEEGGTVKDATFKAMAEVTGPVIAIVLVLSSVFIPVGFLGGLSGVLYKQFAITVAISVCLSGVVALSLTPALCSLILKPGHHDTKHRFFHWFDEVFDKFTGFFISVVKFVLAHAILMTGMFVLVIAGTIYFFKTIPGGLVPNEDQGFGIGLVMMPDATSLDRTAEFTKKVVDIVKDNKNLEFVLANVGYDTISGGQKTSTATFWMSLIDWSKRKGEENSVDGVIKYVFAKTAALPQGIVLAFSPPPIMGLGSTGGIEFFLQNRSGSSPQDLSAKATELINALQKTGKFTSVSTQFRSDAPQLYVQLNREKAMAFKVPVNVAYGALQNTFGEAYVNDFSKFGRMYKVKVQADWPFRMTPEELGKIYTRSTDGNMVPLSSLVDVTFTRGPEIIQRFNGFMAANISAVANADIGMTDGMNIIENAAKEVLPPDFTIGWTGMAYQQSQATSAGTMAIGFGIVMVFLILAAQYENWSLPLAVLMTVPFAAFGALIGAWLRGLSNDIYFQIGIITLIGLAAKNAILIIEFAEIARNKEGKNIYHAILEASRQRLRPILMTSFAFIFGVLPLAVSTGAGAASRHSIGTGVVGGMLMVTFVGIIFVPLFYKIIMDRSFRLTQEEIDGTTPKGASR